MTTIQLAVDQRLNVKPLDLELLAYMKTWKIPSFQRSTNKQRVEDMIKQQQRGTISIGGVFELCEYKGDLYLVDGQHRRELLYSLLSLQTYPNISCLTRIKHVNSEEEMFEWFQFVNESTPVQVYQKRNTHKQSNHVIKYIGEMYDKLLTESENHTCTRINQTRFCNFLSNFHLLNPMWSKEETLSFVEKLNNFFHDHILKFKLTSKQIEICNKNNFYLGIYIKVEKSTTQMFILNELNSYINAC